MFEVVHAMSDKGVFSVLEYIGDYISTAYLEKITQSKLKFIKI